ncbi:hypothetical protein GPALN_005861 [Globodera pallida]|nr:hypothetical protein GPALN_005861 [Globodera pallida]
MLMVPEAEYYALLSAIQGGDYLQNEKSMLDAKIRQNLDDPTIKEDIKASKHNWLYKERRMLKEMTENRPQKVIIENQTPSPNIAPYLGVSQPKTQMTEEPRKAIVPRIRLKSMPEPSEQQAPPQMDQDVSQLPPSTLSSPIFKTPEKFQTTSLIHPDFLNELVNYVSKNKDTFKITAMGKVQSNRNLPIDDSNYKDVLMYLVGGKKETPRGAKFLKDRLLKDPTIREMVGKSSDMWGEGKKVVVRLKPIKTIGILREKKLFKPTIWARL